jgi:hypothetical protein
VAPYIFHPNDPFPCRERQILMAKPVASDAISRSVFRRDELRWIDGTVADTMTRPDLWVKMWTEFLGLRSVGLRVHATRNGNVRGFPYSSKFLAWFSVHQSVLMQCLKPENRPALAVELRKHPFELETLKGNHYTGSAVSGVLAENGDQRPVPGPPPEPLVQCTYCGTTYKQTEPRCTHCGARR